MLASLLSPYDYLVTTMLSGKETLSIEKVTSALLSHEKRMIMLMQTKVLSLPMSKPQSSQGRGKSKGKGSSNRERSQSRVRSDTKKDVECHYCHKKGHYKNQCDELKQNLEGKKNGNKPMESTSIAQDNHTVMSKPIYSQSLQVANSFRVMDFGCSYHMFPNKEWLDTYKPCNGG